MPKPEDESYNRMFSDPHIDQVIKRIKDGTITKAWSWEDDPDKVYIEAMQREKLKELIKEQETKL